MEINNTSAPNNEMKKSFIFILNDINVEGKLPIEVAPGHFFQKADIEQVKMIKQRLPYFMPYISSLLPYEVTLVKIPNGEQGSFKYNSEPLAEEQWKYHIISFEGTNSELQDIGSAASLLEHDLELGFSFLASKQFDGHAFAWHQELLNRYFFDKAFPDPAITIISNEILQISDNYDLIKKVKPEHEYITRVLRKFNDLKSLPRNSELIIIVLFSIIESLITHCPSNRNIDDSINHQIHTKIPLLSKRFPRKLDCTKYFGKTNEEDTWKKLYKYRNSIVHGEHPSLSGSLKKVLKDRDTVYVFLKETVKLLLLLALKEPIFLTDLKKC